MVTMTDETHEGVFRWLGRREMQVQLLRDALRHFGQHAETCGMHRPAQRCTCGYELALTLGVDDAPA